MGRQISELTKNLLQPLTTKEVLEAYSHIELTEEEMDSAILAGKRKKELFLEEEKKKEDAAKKRKLLTAPTTYDLVKGLTQARMVSVFPKEKPFLVDEENMFVYEMLCHYFGESPDHTKESKFIEMANQYGVSSPTLEKGILLAGNPGVGKSYITKLFAKNQRQCYEIKNAKDIAILYKNDGEQAIEPFIHPKISAVEDPSVFYQKKVGLCIDDLGTEDIKGNYGDKKNVIGDLIEQRYFYENCGIMLHGSTNLTAAQMKEYYGERVISRMREIFNFVVLKGKDKRK